MTQHLDIGKIANTHGIKGELKIIPLTDDPSRFEDIDWLYIEINNSLQKYNIESVKYLKSLIVLKFKEINDMSEAEKLKGCFLKIDRKYAIKLPEDTYFICDLIGCTVIDENDFELGILKDIIKTGSNDVYIIKTKGKKDLLIPVLKSVVKEISIENKKIIVKLPEGLLDD